VTTKCSVSPPSTANHVDPYHNVRHDAAAYEQDEDIALKR